MARIRAASCVISIVAFGLSIASAFAQTIVVGGKNNTEQFLMAEITSQLLIANGYTVDQRTGLGSAAIRKAQESGQVDVYWEYTGTSLIVYNGIKEKLTADEGYARVKEIDGQKGLIWLEPSRANNTYAIAMRKADAAKRGIASISELAKKVNGGEKLTFASNAEFYSRPDGLGPMEEAYGFKFERSDIMRMESGLVYQALRDSQTDVGLVFATDGRIPAFDFQVLKDDKGYFPTYAMAPVIRKESLESNKKIGDLLNALSSKIDDQTMARLNASVDVDKKTIADVATEFLASISLVK